MSACHTTTKSPSPPRVPLPSAKPPFRQPCLQLLLPLVLAAATPIQLASQQPAPGAEATPGKEAPEKPPAKPAEQPPAGAADAAASTPPAVPEWTDAQAKEALGALRKVTSKSPLNERMQAVEALAQGSNKLLVAPLAKVVRTESAVAVRAAAARALGAQPAKPTAPVLMQLLADGSVGEPEVVRELLVAVERTGYGPRDWKNLEKLFEKGGFDARWVPVQKALLKLVRTYKEHEAIDLLLQHMDEPGPADVHSGANPPAEYWERRWKAWQSWRADVVEALFAITGQRFSAAAEAKAWLQANERKLKQRRG